MKVKLIIVRHGFSTSNAFYYTNPPNLEDNLQDSPLTNIGIDVTSLNGKKLMRVLNKSNIKPDLVCASSLCRAIATAHHMTGSKNIISLPYLKEAGRNDFPPNWPLSTNFQTVVLKSFQECNANVNMDLVSNQSKLRWVDGDLENGFIPWLQNGGLEKMWKLMKQRPLPDQVTLFVVAHGNVMNDFLKTRTINFEPHPRNNEAFIGTIKWLTKNKPSISQFIKIPYTLYDDYPANPEFYKSDPLCQWAQ
jgi:broad specificity phosphatase PhoE